MACSPKKYLFAFFSSVLLLTGLYGSAQAQQTTPPADTTKKIEPMLPPVQYGPYDTILVPAKVYNGELLSAHTMEWTWVTKPMPPGMRKKYEEWTRLRNAVYVTYPYARKAGIILNEMNAKLALLTSEEERKAYIKSREKDLKKEFTTPLENMSIYQGRVLMKLINRQTGNNCYDIIKEYKGGFTARFYQTVAFFFSSNLKQPYDPKGDDQVIETIVQEVERMYRG
ncbi:MAG TPA: DUF4294 domain-containing protein [Puia sp.]|nr:DUF4294 domain-containing protein [Puia sp.]